MFLKSLTLKGFKSFAEATVLDLEPGITVVVGPNGSGKSNVVDAIGWVLGAQAPSTVRSQKMDDVIFAGTAKRPALGRAEVSLTIDNSAGLLPIAFSEVTITRTLFRSGDSEYAINGTPCRLLDIQDLLSDTGVGRQQHVIIGQGQIDAILNARPEDRRLVIEEAAGILKFRKRKERAERKLAATEASLLRLQDLLREVRRQLRPLERQAEAARRHGGLVAELQILRRHVAGREFATLRDRLENGARARAELAAEELALKAHLAQLDAGVLAAESELSAMGPGAEGLGDLSDRLVRTERVVEKARGLAAVLAERGRSIDRERGAAVDAAVVASLEAEAARLAAELVEVEAAAANLAPDAERLATEEAALADERHRLAARGSDAVVAAAPAAGPGAAEVRGELAALRAGGERSFAELARLRQREDLLVARVARLEEDADRLRDEAAAAEEAEGPLADGVAAAEAVHAAARRELAAAEEDRRVADAERHSWGARADALAQALEAARARAGAEHLAEIDGVAGTLLDLVEIDAGWEAAFEAAAGEALAAVIVESVDAGRRALAHLRAGKVAGAVVALGAGPGTGVPLVPSAGELLRHHVRGRGAGVDALLDALLGHAVVVAGDDVRAGWEVAVDVAVAHPDALVVTVDGDRFGFAGWRVGGPGTGATGAALEEATERATTATAAAEAAEARLAAAHDAVMQAAAHEDGLARALNENDGRFVAATDGITRLQADRRDAETELDGLRSHLADLSARADAEAARIAELETRLPLLEAEEAGAAEQRRALAAARASIDERVAAVAALRTDLEVRAASLEERRGYLRQRAEEVEQRLARNAGDRRAAESRRVELEHRAVAVDRLAVVVSGRLTAVEAELGELHERRRRQSDAARAVAARLELLRRERAAEERSLEASRERSRRAELDEAETKLRLETAVEVCRRDLDCDPDVAMATVAPDLPDGVTANGRVRELERELRLLGPINPLALEEFEELQGRNQFLEEQLDDVKSTRRDLGKVIRAVDEEIVTVFAAAYADVAANFEVLFETLFPGGTGRLRLTLPEDLLNTGIELEAKPSGKNVKKLSLLSGGERSLTALAYLFAVFRARPSPFYVMDEVEAALDDVNLHRFLALVHEFREDAQLLIVSHQKRTMEAADFLYGVTMQPGGSSKVVSERVSAGA
jgi:chromosome segregation protein